jgi:hypothetical protein
MTKPRRILDKLPLFQVGIIPLSPVQARALNHFLLLVGERGCEKAFLEHFDHETFLHEIEDSATRGHAKNEVSRLKERYSEEYQYADRESIFRSTFQQQINELKSGRLTLETLAAKGRTWGKSLMGAFRNCGLSASRPRIGTGMVQLLLHNAIPQALMASLDVISDRIKRTRHLLWFISNHRAPASDETVWQIWEVEAPTIEQVRDLLRLVVGVSLNSRMPSPQRVALFFLIRDLAGSLLKCDMAYLLDSPAYRKLLWENLESILWFECCRDIHEAMRGDN